MNTYGIFLDAVENSIMDASSYLRAIPGHSNKSLQTVIVNVCFYAHFCAQFCATPSDGV